MGSFMIGFILYLVANLLFLPLTGLNLIAVFWKYKTIKGYFYQGAIDIDMFANRNFRTLFNVCLRKKGGYAFGNPKETISSVLGKNQRDKTLSFVGVWVSYILDKIGKDHCKKSINNNI